MICAYCEEPILDGERCRGTDPFFHHECLVRACIGSAAHQLRECSCYGGLREDPPGMSKRAAAILAYQTWLELTRNDQPTASSQR